MIANLMMMGSRYLSSFRSQRGAVAWEYLLVIGVVSVAVVTAAAGINGFTDDVVAGVCGAVDATITAFDIPGC